MSRRKNLVAGLCLVAQFTWGQDLEIPPVAVVSSAHFANSLFKGVDNYIDVVVPGVPCTSLSVRPAFGRITGEGCSYTVNSGSVQRSLLTLQISWKDEAGNEKTDSVRFRLKELLAKAYFAAENSDADSLSVRAAKVGLGLVVKVVEGGFDLSLHVTGYRLILEHSCQRVFDGTSSAAELTNAMKDALQSCSAGDRLYIQQITAKFPSGAEGTVDDLRFVLY